MHALTHRPCSLMLVLMIDALALMLLLNASGSRLEGCQIHWVRVHELLGGGDDVGDETVEQIQRHALADDDAENLCLLALGGKWVVGDDVLLGA